MEKRLQMKMLWFFCALFVFAATLNGKDHCPLVVKVVGSDGRYVIATVKVEEHDGRTIETESETGIVRFCDLDILPLTVAVGQGAPHKNPNQRDRFSL